MSHAIKIFDGTSAADVEKLTGDVGGAVGPDGSFNISLLTGDGLTSTGTPGSNLITFTLDGYTEGTGSTVGAVTTDLITIALGATPTTYTIEAKVAGFESTTPAGCGYDIVCSARTTGAAATIINLQDKYNTEEAALVSCDANFVASGNNVILRVTGTAGLTVNWKASTLQIGV